MVVAAKGNAVGFPNCVGRGGLDGEFWMAFLGFGESSPPV